MKSMTEAELRFRLNKALADADYWRIKYDDLLLHIEHQTAYIRHLEQQVWGGVSK